MPREQIQRLNKTLGTEVQAGVLQTGITQTSNMGYVQQQKTSGQRLAESLGMAVNVGTKVAELYQGQLDEEAVNQFNKDKYAMLDELNSLPSNADKKLWMINKTQELSNPGVNARYRNAFLNSFDGIYNTISKNVIEEGYIAQDNLMSSEFMEAIASGKINYDEISNKYSAVLPKSRFHKNLVVALEAQLKFEASSIQDPESLEAFSVKAKDLLKQYRENPYTGGSKSVESVNLQTTLNKSINSLETGFKKQFKEQHDLVIAKLTDNPGTLTVDAFNKINNKGLALGVTPKEHYERQQKFLEERKKWEKIDALSNLDWINDPMLSNNYSKMSSEEKDYIKENAFKNLDFTIEGGFYRQAATTLNNLPDSISKDYVTSLFSIDNKPNEIIKKLPTYKALSKSFEGRVALGKLDKNSRALFELLEANPNPSLIDSYQAYLTTGEKFSFGSGVSANNDIKKWNKAMVKLPFHERETAIAIRDYVYATSKDFNKAMKVVDTYMDKTVVKEGKRNFTGFTDSLMIPKINKTLESMYPESEFDTVIEADDHYIIRDSDNPLLQTKVSKQSVLTKIADDRLKQDTPYTIDDFRSDVKTFGGYVNRELEYFVSHAFSKKNLEELSLAIPAAVTAKLGVEAYNLGVWMKNSGAVGEFILNTSSNVVSRGNLQWGRDLLQKAGYNVLIKDTGKMVVSKGPKALVAGGAITVGASQSDLQASTDINQINEVIQNITELPINKEDIKTLYDSVVGNNGEAFNSMSIEEIQKFISNPTEAVQTMEAMLDTEGGSSYVANGDANRIPQTLSTTANSTVTNAFNSFSSLEGNNVHIDTANIFTMAGGVVPNANSIRVKNPSTNQWETINPKNKPSWITKDNVKNLEIDYTNASYTIPGTNIKINYADDPATFNERILSKYDSELAQSVTGYNNLNDATKTALIQNAWNTGPNGVTWSGFRTAISYIQNNNLTANSLTSPTDADKQALLKPAVSHNASSGSILAALMFRRTLVYNSVVSPENKIDGIKVTKNKNKDLVFNFYNGQTLVHSAVNTTRIKNYGNKLNKLYQYTTGN